MTFMNDSDNKNIFDDNVKPQFKLVFINEVHDAIDDPAFEYRRALLCQRQV